MHKAYVLHPPSKISVQIESITGYKNIVFLGTRFVDFYLRFIEIVMNH